ncbi:unnamed protein product [Lampetra fluviatilis]
MPRGVNPFRSKVKAQRPVLRNRQTARETLEVCVGTENLFSTLATPELQFQALRKTYENCEVVLGNLEVTNIARHQNISFLKVRGPPLLARSLTRAR